MYDHKTKKFGHFRTTSSMYSSLLRHSKKRVITAVFDPSTPLLPENEIYDLKIRDQALMYGHNCAAFFNHFLTYLNFSTIFNAAEIREGRRIFFRNFYVE